MPIKKWNPGKVLQMAEERDGPLSKRMIAAGFYLERTIKRSFDRTKPSGRRSKKSDHVPSEPGSPPHVDTGRLRASITTNWSTNDEERARVNNPATTSKSTDGVSKPPGTLRVRVGTNVEYGIHLELGAPARNLEPRPFLRPAWDSEKRTMKKIIEGKRG